jgi:catechol 2,3-dioxygenase-like lactoylglutathione lyase family enzyme
MPVTITSFDHVAITVADLEATCAFYDKLFGVRVGMNYSPDGKSLVRQIFIGGGDTMLSVHQYGNGIDLVAKKPTPGSVDLCMRWAGKIEDVAALLAKHNVPITDGPSPRTFSDGRKSRSIYFRDPDGNLIELMAAS